MPRTKRPPPQNWKAHRSEPGASWAAPFRALEWTWEWLAHFLANWAFIEVLEYLGKFSVLVAVIYYFATYGDRLKQKHYQAWQVINTAQGKGGSGGRIDALQELNEDGVALVGLDVSGAFLFGVKLAGANLTRSSMQAVDLRHADFSGGDLSYADLGSANLRNASLRKANLQHASLDDCDLTEADLSGADLTGASLSDADLTGADMKGVVWKNLKSAERANIQGIRNAPAGFAEWAMANGAVRAR